MNCEAFKSRGQLAALWLRAEGACVRRNTGSRKEGGVGI